jgi:predicted ATP-dependent protease
MIPVQNAKNLMLRRDLVDAVAAGQFRIYAVGTIDEGIEILTGVPAGVRISGAFEERTVNYYVDQRLKEFSESMRKYASEEPLRAP